MENITNLASLKEAIINLEEKQSNEWVLIKDEALLTYENIKPINLLKSTLKQALYSPVLKENITNTVVGLTTGFLAKKAIVGKTKNPFKNLLGLILEMAVANKIASNADSIKALGHILINKLIPSKQEVDE